MKTFACGLFSNTVDCQIYYFFASIQSFKLHLTAGIIKLFLLLLPSEILGLKYATKFLLVFCFLSNEAHYRCNRTRAPYVIKKIAHIKLFVVKLKDGVECWNLKCWWHISSTINLWLLFQERHQLRWWWWCFVASSWIVSMMIIDFQRTHLG